MDSGKQERAMAKEAPSHFNDIGASLREVSVSFQKLAKAFHDSEIEESVRKLGKLWDKALGHNRKTGNNS